MEDDTKSIYTNLRDAVGGANLRDTFYRNKVGGRRHTLPYKESTAVVKAMEEKEFQCSIERAVNENKDRVKADIEEKFKDDNNPVLQFLRTAGVLEDMELLRTLIMQSMSSSEVSLYTAKLSAIKSYIATVKDTVTMQAQQAKTELIRKDADDEDDTFEGIEVTMHR